jgi:capsule polysaccharide export protein KpsE/RkpR
MYWMWEDQCIKFNPNGCSGPREIQLKYVRQPIQLATDENSIIGTIGVRSFLAYKTAALCSMFIGENQTRADILNTEAAQAMERLLGIGNKGRQEIFTRRRPFRASYKARGVM